MNVRIIVVWGAAILARIGGFILSAVPASAFYVTWIVVSLESQLGPSSAKTDLEVALFIMIFAGFGAALALMSLPWIVAVWGYSRLQRWGQIYFAGIGAVLMFVLGCITSSLSPKPLFIEDQTFLEGAIIAAERQGICLALAGTIFGLSYWYLCERPCTALRNRANQASGG